VAWAKEWTVDSEIPLEKYGIFCMPEDSPKLFFEKLNMCF
jgi:hypothetical protein